MISVKLNPFDELEKTIASSSSNTSLLAICMASARLARVCVRSGTPNCLASKQQTPYSKQLDSGQLHSDSASEPFHISQASRTFSICSSISISIQILSYSSSSSQRLFLWEAQSHRDEIRLDFAQTRLAFAIACNHSLALPRSLEWRSQWQIAKAEIRG